MQNISFAMTTEQQRNKSKTVTRRTRWLRLKPGTLLQGVVKGMGLKLGETVEKLNIIRTVSVRRESLERMLIDLEYGREECVKEGFPDLTPEQFVTMFLKHNRKMNVRDSVTRIEFYYPSAEEVEAILADMDYIKKHQKEKS